MFALDVAPLRKLQEKYGSKHNAEGFNYLDKFKPSIIFKPKLKK
jgi:hypothetical protein